MAQVDTIKIAQRINTASLGGRDILKMSENVHKRCLFLFFCLFTRPNHRDALFEFDINAGAFCLPPLDYPIGSKGLPKSSVGRLSLVNSASFLILKHDSKEMR